MREGLLRLEPTVDIYLSSVSLRADFWLPKLAEEIAATDAFLLLIGPGDIGPWQDLEYLEALDRHVHEKERFPVVPLIAAGANAPGLPLLRRLNWVESPIITEDKALHRVLAALKGETVATTTPLWRLVNPYRGLEAMTEANTARALRIAVSPKLSKITLPGSARRWNREKDLTNEQLCMITNRRIRCCV